MRNEQYEQITDAMAHSYGPGEHLPADLVCTHADRAKGEKLCPICLSAAQAKVDGKPEEESKVSEALLDDLLRRAIKQVAEKFAPRIAVLDVRHGRFVDAHIDGPQPRCVHDQYMHKECAQCDVMNRRLNVQGGGA